MRGLVFGGTGMLGQSVVACGRRRGAGVLGLSRAQADLTDPERLLYWVDEFRPEVVFNCAAFTQVDDCEEREDDALAVNGAGVAHALNAARSVGARLIHVSTDYVFDGEGDEPYLETAPTAPRSAYGRTKLEGERQALADPSSAVVRTSWLFGPGGPNFVNTMVRLIDGGMNPLRVVADQVGCPTYTPFLANALWDLAELGQSKPEAASGVFHYGNRSPTSWHGFASEIARAWKPSVAVDPVTTDEFPRPAPRPAYSVMSTERFESAVGRGVEPWIWGLYDHLDRLRRERGGTL